MSSFDDAFTALIGNEGGYVNNPADPGGETMFGVTARVARAHGYAGAMKDLPRDTAKAIAKTVYWDPLHLDEFDPRIAFQMVDANYNGGATVRWAQQASGAPVDGVMGPNTIAAIKAADPRTFCLTFLARRLQYLAGLKTWPTFGRGWSNRIASNMLKGAN
jgi:lysozyme family protein